MHDWIEPSDPGMPEPIIRLHQNGVVQLVAYKNNDGQLHRSGRPSLIIWHPNGIKASEEWHQNGRWYRVNGPFIVRWDPTGVKIYEDWNLSISHTNRR